MPHPFTDRLSSRRLYLRRLHPDDAEAICDCRSRIQVARFQYWESFDRDDAARLIEAQSIAEPNVPGTWFQLAIIKTDAGCMIGDCGLHCPKDEPRQMEIGITLAPRYQGHRYADEATECLLQYCFAVLGKHRVFAYIDVENRSAVALCLRLDFRREAHLVEHRWFKNRWQSEYVFAMLSREWENAPARSPRRIFDAGRDFGK
jgi:RimJ/RimL family protein N-acetyltransferase